MTSFYGIGIYSVLVALLCNGAWGFEKKNIKLGSVQLKVEIAQEESERRRGLMHRKSLGSNEGMLFVFEGESPRSFWMRNTYIPLSLGFFDAQKKLVEITSLAASKTGQEEVPRYQSEKAAQYVLEVNKGWFEKNGITTGAEFEFLGP